MSVSFVSTSSDKISLRYSDNYYTNAIYGVIPIEESATNESQSSDSTAITYRASQGQSFHIEKADNFSEDQPLLIVSGTDENGDVFQEIIDPTTVDPENASYIEYSAFASWLTDYGKRGNFQKNLIPCQTDNIFDKTDYLRAARKWREERISIGDMLGFRKGIDECSAVTTYLKYKNTNLNSEQINSQSKMSYIIDLGTKNEGFGQSFVIGTGNKEKIYRSKYASNSTAENPIIDVYELPEDGIPTNIHPIKINQIDPRNATQMEMYALCAHAENIRNNGKYPEDMNTGYYAGVMNGIFDADNWNDFIETKKDWTKALTEITNSDQNSYRKASATELMDFIRKYLVKFQESTVDANSEVTSEMVDQLFEDRDQKI